MSPFRRTLALLPLAGALALGVATPAAAESAAGPVVSRGSSCVTAATVYGSLGQLSDGVLATSAADPAWVQLNNSATFQLSCTLPAQQRISSVQIRFESDATHVAPSQVVIMTRPDANTAWTRLAVVARPAAVAGVATYAATTDRVVGQAGFIVAAQSAVWSDEFIVRGWPTQS